MKIGLSVLLFIVFYFSLSFGAEYAGEINTCAKAEKNGAEVVWIQHKLLKKACYIDVIINDTPVKFDAEDWLKYFVYNKE